ncbi:hypothetical protein [Glycomyces buryatensis]|uniref:Uncharacterized protein n=1 Tax=Glycomyces buryatensis TaxID=2570927 RepID=A0A4S8QQ38_9ACTN|nr:hypothetical protein [Glycomyces buryatensis]THV42834.1 hypothetical protein FAB82_04325 [Glycomyces buryatensis]
MSGLSAYNDLVHDMARLDADSTATAEKAQRQLERQRTLQRELEAEIEETTASLAEACAALRHTAPDLNPEPSQAEDIDSALTSGRVALREAADAHTAMLRAARRPTLLPGVHHVVRELLVYGSCMVACLLGQVIWLKATGGGGQEAWSVMFLPPVAACLIGYVLVGAANKPRLPMLDRSGKAIKPVVFHNPRLGVTLAVVTMAVFAYLAFVA